MLTVVGWIVRGEEKTNTRGFQGKARGPPCCSITAGPEARSGRKERLGSNRGGNFFRRVGTWKTVCDTFQLQSCRAVDWICVRSRGTPPSDINAVLLSLPLVPI